MADPHYTLQQLAMLTGATLVGDADMRISGVSDLETAEAHDAAFLANPRYEQAMKSSHAGVIFLAAEIARIPGRNYLVTADPSAAFQKVVELFHPPLPFTGFEGIHPTAVIHPTAKLASNVTVGPYAVIDKEVSIGPNSCVGSGAYIGVKVTIGQNCLLHPHCIIREGCTLADRIVIQPGAVIGSCGFGFIPGPDGKPTKLQQVGNVIIDSDVEIGANTTIDRGRFKATRIGLGTKIDNLVQIAHGVSIGRFNLIVAQVGIAGSSRTGDGVILAGQSALVGHISIPSGTTLAGRGAISKTLTKPGKYAGAPAIPLDEFHRREIHLRNLAKYVERLQALEKEVLELRSKPR